MTAGGLEVRPATLAEQLPVRRMLELYQHDLSDIWDQDLDVHGEYGYFIDRYWEAPRHHAYVFLVDGRFAGLALVDDQVRLPGDELWMAQFFVVRKYRRRGVGRRAARTIFDLLRGRWEVGQMPLNLPARDFWRRTIGDYTGGAFVEHRLDDRRWEGWLHCFDNRAASA